MQPHSAVESPHKELQMEFNTIIALLQTNSKTEHSRQNVATNAEQ